MSSPPFPLSADQLIAGLCDLTLSLEQIKVISDVDIDNFKKYWLSYVIFNETYQSDTFTLHDTSPMKSRDTRKVQYFYRTKVLENQLPKEIIGLFPFHIYLCSEEGIQGLATIDPFNINNNISMDTINTEFPIIYHNWLNVSPLDTNNTTLLLKVHLEVKKEEVETPLQQPEKQMDKEDIAIPPPPPPSRPIPIPITTTTTQSTSDIHPDNILHHYRINVNFMSLKNLIRPAYLGLQCTYPHLGSGHVIRTPPQWFPSHSETNIPKGYITYETAITKNRLRDIFQTFPMKVDILQRSQLGLELLGYGMVNLLPILSSQPHSFRCPITQQIFHTLAKYTEHRERLVQQYDCQEIDQLPSATPEIVYTHDTYLELVDQRYSQNNTRGGGVLLQSARLRVMVIVEDLGQVGKEIGLSIKPGYTMHAGGFYNQQQFPPADTCDTDDSDNHNHRNNNTHNDMQQEQLLEDWERWRKEQEILWREELQQKEIQLRKQLQDEHDTILATQLANLQQSQQQVQKLEVKLKASLESIEKQQMKLTLYEEQLQSKHLQKMQEVELLTKRLKNESRQLIEHERLKNTHQQEELATVKLSLQSMEKKKVMIENEYELLKGKFSKSVTMKLQEEIMVLKTQLMQQTETSKQDHDTIATLQKEKEQYRQQLYQVAQALKREREKNNIVARQELEQLRLEFLAREERFALDGDRMILQEVRNELATLKHQSSQQSQQYFQHIS